MLGELADGRGVGRQGFEHTVAEFNAAVRPASSTRR
jgi:hypothetical protein